MIRNLLLAAAAVLGLGLTTLALAAPPVKRFGSNVPIKDIKIIRDNKIVLPPDIKVAEHASCGTYANRIDRGRFNRYNPWRR